MQFQLCCESKEKVNLLNKQEFEGLSGRRRWKIVPENGGSLDLQIGGRSDW